MPLLNQVFDIFHNMTSCTYLHCRSETISKLFHYLTNQQTLFSSSRELYDPLLQLLSTNPFLSKNNNVENSQLLSNNEKEIIGSTIEILSEKNEMNNQDEEEKKNQIKNEDEMIFLLFSLSPSISKLLKRVVRLLNYHVNNTSSLTSSNSLQNSSQFSGGVSIYSPIPSPSIFHIFFDFILTSKSLFFLDDILLSFYGLNSTISQIIKQRTKQQEKSNNESSEIEEEGKNEENPNPQMNKNMFQFPNFPLVTNFMINLKMEEEENKLELLNPTFEPSLSTSEEEDHNKRIDEETQYGIISQSDFSNLFSTYQLLPSSWINLKRSNSQLIKIEEDGELDYLRMEEEEKLLEDHNEHFSRSKFDQWEKWNEILFFLSQVLYIFINFFILLYFVR